jgi:hypothetical protein
VSVFKAIGAAFKGIIALFRSSWTSIRGVFTSAGKNLVATVRGWVDTVRLRIWYGMDAIKAAIKAGWNFIKSIFTNTLTAIRSSVTGAFNTIRATIQGVISAVRTIISSGMSAARTAVSNAMTAVRTGISNAMTSARTAVSNGIQRIINFFKNLPGRIVRALGDVGNMLRGAGRKIIEGLIGGITAMGDKVKDAVKGVLSKARDLLPFSPAKEGPFAGRGWTLYAGRSLIDGLVQGIEREERPLVRAVSGVMASAQDAMHPDALLPSLDVQSAFQVDRGGFDVTSTAAREELEQLRRMARAQEDTIRMLQLQTERLEQATRQLVSA